MARIIILIAMLYSATASLAEAPTRTHIENLIPIEKCVYRAKLGAAASWLRIQKKATSCQDMEIYWHGDETDYEIAFIKEYLCEGFMLDKDPIKTGDIMYTDCFKKLQ